MGCQKGEAGEGDPTLLLVDITVAGLGYLQPPKFWAVDLDRHLPPTAHSTPSGSF